MGKAGTFVAALIYLIQIRSSQAQQHLTQYMQLTGLGPSLPAPSIPQGPPPNFPSNHYGPAYPSFQNYQAPTRSVSPNPPAPLSAVASLSASVPVPAPSKIPAVPKAAETLRPAGLDSNVLNNLAIALQLLIVSNILNMPAVESPAPAGVEFLQFDSLPKFAKYESLPIAPAISYPMKSISMSLPNALPFLDSPISQKFYSFESPSVPNSNFLSSSGFVEPSMFGSSVGTARPNPRSSMTLMSPYEALGPSSPFSDPILSSVYSPGFSKKDFKSPYASILAADGSRDMVSLTDLF